MKTQRWVILLITLASLLTILTAVSAQDNPDTNIIPGRIAYIGSDFNVYSIDPNSGAPIQLTNDAGITDNKLRLYQWPTWSTDGRLAYFATELERSGGGRTEVLISPDGAQDGASAVVFERDTFTYAYWSPRNCAVDATCRDLAVLLTRPSAGGFVVELVRDLSEQDTHILTDSGSPFYFSWSPTGAEMLWHRNSVTVEQYDIGSDTAPTRIDQTPGGFAAPAWSPVDDRLLFAERNADGKTNNLVVLTGQNLVQLASGLSDPVAFSWSPDGSKIAYASQEGPVIVLDSHTGEEVSRTTVGGIASFFWSPDSIKIAYITLASLSGSFGVQADSGTRLASMVQESPGIAWSVLNITTGDTFRYGAFTPTRDLVYLLSYFDQFSQSHRVWSPDSRYLVYSEMLNDNQAAIRLLDTSQSTGIPVTLAEGAIGIWSFQ